jgi:YaiO family outer membrane protein
LQEAQLSLRKNTASGPFIVRGASVRQFGVRDEKIDVEAYPAFRGGYLTLAGSRASSGRLYAQSMLSALLFKSLPGQFEASAGYRRLNFSSPVSIATASIGNYFRDYQFGVRVNRMAGATHGLSTSASARQYLTDDGQYIGLIATVGSVRDQIRTAADLGDQSNKSVAAEAMFVLASRWIVSSRASIGLDELSRGPSAVASSLTLGFGVRF